MKNKFMQYALSEAKKAAKAGEVPVGAAVFIGDRLVSSAHNLIEASSDPTAHAEILAIKKACEVLKTRRLTEASIYVTLEPCAMCAGAIINSRLSAVYFGAYDSLSGAAGGKIDLFRENLGTSSPAVYGGICEEECSTILSDFFKKARITN